MLRSISNSLGSLNTLMLRLLHYHASVRHRRQTLLQRDARYTVHIKLTLDSFDRCNSFVCIYIR